MSQRGGATELWIQAGAELGEGPHWDDATQQLTWVDILRGEIHCLDADRRHAVVTLDEAVGSAVPLADRSGWVAGVRSGVVVVDRTGRISERVDIDADRREHRMNDGACDSLGRFWSGTKNDGPGPWSDSLYRVDPDLTVTEVIQGVGLANGIAWSPDDRWMYFVDSAAGTVTSYPFDLATGNIGEGSVLIEIDPSTGEPDGLTVDSEGCLWLAIWDGARVDRFAPDGRLVQSVGVPTPRPTSCALADTPDGTHLVITTASIGLDPHSAAGDGAAGAIFRTRVAARALPSTTFSGRQTTGSA